jgi:hypothetical protein
VTEASIDLVLAELPVGGDCDKSFDRSYCSRVACSCLMILTTINFCSDRVRGWLRRERVFCFHTKNVCYRSTIFAIPNISMLSVCYTGAVEGSKNDAASTFLSFKD